METLDVLKRISRLAMTIALLAFFARTGGAAETDISRAGAADIAAARAVFEKNIQAIRAQDKTAYLACYLDSEALARTGFEGPQLG
ncbi:MAG TPA: hypothetical protein VGQ28_09495, partial [Thermoanaerobaculia bacterium]|nr:hypothetical protein [Thermoanaerobaculia bacterium]